MATPETRAPIPRSVAVALAGAILALTTINVVWLLRFRWGYPTEWDESGYLSIGVHDWTALTRHGLLAFVRAVETQPVEAPLVPAIAALVFAVSGAGMGQGVLLVCIFAALLVAATFAVALVVMDAWWSLLAAVVVGGMPLVIDYTRLFHFSVPAAALFTAAVWALLRSDCLARRSWVIAAGALVGLTVLARTMTVAYLPAIAVAAGIQFAATEGARRARLTNAMLGALSCGFVAALWYARNWASVRDYLTSRGYGGPSLHYGTGRSILSTGYWTRIVAEVANDLYLPLASVLLLCLLMAALHVVARIRTSQRPPVSGFWKTNEFVLVVVVLEGYLAMTSSKNSGTAFALPWLPALVVASIAAVSRTPWRTWRRIGATLLVAVATLDVAMKSGFVPGVSDAARADVPVIGTVTVAQGKGLLQTEVLAGAGGTATSPPPSLQRGWPAFERGVVRRIDRCSRSAGEINPVGYVATSSQILSNTSFGLAAALGREDVTFRWLTPYVDTVAGFRAALEPSQIRFLMTAPAQRGSGPKLSLNRVGAAARTVGFRIGANLPMPDGRVLRLWWRNPAARAICRAS